MKIVDVVGLINDIAAQTNLLAHNINEAAMGTKQVSTHIVSVSEAAQHTGAAATRFFPPPVNWRRTAKD